MQPWMLGLMGGGGPVRGEAVYDTPGTYTFVVPSGVTSVCAVAIGPGENAFIYEVSPVESYGFAGSGGSLRWRNNIQVTPGQSLTVVVGAGGSETDSYFINSTTVRGRAGVERAGGAGDGGGDGGLSTYSGMSRGGGGGAGGYTGNGGAGGDLEPGNAGLYGSGGGGGGGGGNGGGGGGVGLFGIGNNGIGGGTTSAGGGGGSGGSDGTSPDMGSAGGAFGGGGGVSIPVGIAGIGGGGAVRIIWGEGRSFPYNAA